MSVALMFVVSLDLGGRFTDSEEVVRALRVDPSFADASVGTRFDERLQLSYRHGSPSEVVATRSPCRLDLDSWSGEAMRLITLHPSGVITYELELPLRTDEVSLCTRIEDDLDEAMRVRYIPYLRAAYGATPLADAAHDPSDRGVDFITLTERIRDLTSGLVVARPRLYPGLDLRMGVMVQTTDLDLVEQTTLADFVEARRDRAQWSPQSTDERMGGGRAFDVRRSEVTARRWRSLLYASCDADAALMIVSDPASARIGNDCLAMAQKMWFLSRTWAGALDQLGTLEVADDVIERGQLSQLERQVLDLSSLEYEVAHSMTTVDAAGMMLRDTWHVELVGIAMSCFGIESQRRLIDRRLQAVARNHDTVSEILDRAHQNQVRLQADRLQRLFAGAVAASVTALVPALVSLDQPVWSTVTTALTAVLWVVLAIRIWHDSARPIRLAPRPGSSRLLWPAPQGEGGVARLFKRR